MSRDHLCHENSHDGHSYAYCHWSNLSSLLSSRAVYTVYNCTDLNFDRPQEKPKVVPAPAPPPAAIPEPAPPIPVNEPVEVELTPQPEPPLQLEQEEPTTVQAPVWDDEPTPSTQITSDGWITSASEVPVTKVSIEEEESVPSTQPESAAPTITPQVPLQKAESPVVPPAKPVTPLSTRPLSTHRISNRFKTSDQPVVMPTNFGSNIEKIGMMFGSVTLGRDDVLDSL